MNTGQQPTIEGWQYPSPQDKAAHDAFLKGMQTPMSDLELYQAKRDGLIPLEKKPANFDQSEPEPEILLVVGKAAAGIGILYVAGCAVVAIAAEVVAFIHANALAVALVPVGAIVAIGIGSWVVSLFKGESDAPPAPNSGGGKWRYYQEQRQGWEQY